MIASHDYVMLRKRCSDDGEERETVGCEKSASGKEFYEEVASTKEAREEACEKTITRQTSGSIGERTSQTISGASSAS